jgi:multidrug efflux pump subunit AcrA (membrane-fusion protein)
MNKIEKIEIQIKFYIISSFLVLSLFLFFKIDSAINANGILLSREEKKTVEHLEGGIVDKIFVKNGSHVEVGDPLIRLDGTQISATLENIRKNLAVVNRQYDSLIKLEEKGIYDYLKKAEIEKEKIKLEADLRKIQDVNKKITIVANYSGIVNDLLIKGEGEIVAPKNKILEIIPDSEELLVHLEVNPRNIMFIKRGMKIKILIQAANPKYNEFLYTNLDYISADVIVKPNGHSYYLATATINKNDIKKYDLLPGMQVTGYIILGERYIIQYLFDPIYKTLINAFYEV